VDLAGEDRAQELLLLRLAARVHQRRSDRVQRDERDRRARTPRLLEPDQLLDRGASLAAVLLGPADAEPAVAAHLPDQLLVQRAGLEAVQLRAQLGSDQLGEVGAQLGAQRLLLGRVVDVHGGSRDGPT
jgi:hypothetical protein